MITDSTLRTLALALPEATEEAHFEKTSYRVKKKIFATYDAKRQRACLKLSLADQDVFSVLGKDAIYAVDNAWGRQGWTMIELSIIDEPILADALIAAYIEVAPKKLSLPFMQHKPPGW